MAQGVVYDLEAVEVHEQDRRLAASRAPSAFEGMPKTIHEELAVGQPSERVVQRLELQLLLHALALGDVLHLGDGVERLAGRSPQQRHGQVDPDHRAAPRTSSSRLSVPPLSPQVSPEGLRKPRILPQSGPAPPRPTSHIGPLQPCSSRRLYPPSRWRSRLGPSTSKISASEFLNASSASLRSVTSREATTTPSTSGSSSR